MGMVAAESGWLWELTGEFGREVAACLYYWAMGFIQKKYAEVSHHRADAFEPDPGERGEDAQLFQFQFCKRSLDCFELFFNEIFRDCARPPPPPRWPIAPMI